MVRLLDRVLPVVSRAGAETTPTANGGDSNVTVSESVFDTASETDTGHVGVVLGLRSEGGPGEVTDDE
ncbi:hypothetical protein [Halapricum desulfuricans]|uniref:Uncharacterized protein n=1 Tax=Halapricum desulfuricans TaxID=2841257 RepID=A0A897MZR1_9EURY|nr:hypothetical protein [Halapricum desulfuricans]QSG05937.1 hypothetical protein HSR121_1600 [Halapricum desulfuricans]